MIEAIYREFIETLTLRTLGEILYTAWWGYCWTLRGGGWGALMRKIGRSGEGTDEARFAASVLMILPALIMQPQLYLYWAAAFAGTFISMKIGYFDNSMGLEKPGRHHIFLALWGFTVSLIQLLPNFLIGLFFTSIMPGLTLSIVFHATIFYAPLGMLAMVGYAACKKLEPNGHWTQDAEFIAGCVFFYTFNYVWGAI